jgi:hypothetical protein
VSWPVIVGQRRHLDGRSISMRGREQRTWSTGALVKRTGGRRSPDGALGRGHNTRNLDFKLWISRN